MSVNAPAPARDGEPAIRVRGMEKSYKSLQVLRGVDFDVAPGSIFALLGSNGAGKTTMVRILSTLLKPDGGAATVNGFDIGARPVQVRESISLTGQFAAVDEILTGRENLVLAARLRHLKDPGAVADDLHHRDHADRTDAAVRLRVRRRHQDRYRQLHQLPAARNHADRDRVGYRVHRCSLVHRYEERHFRAVPVHADRPVVRAGASGSWSSPTSSRWLRTGGRSPKALVN